MPKIKVKTSLIEHHKITPTIKFECRGTIKDNCLTYHEKDLVVTLIYEKKVATLIREDANYKLNLLFEEEKRTAGSYLLKEENLVLPIEIKTNKLEINEDKILIDYQINVDDGLTNYFTFILTYEVIK